MAKQVINNGASAGDGSGESLYDAFGKCINNFDELYQFIVDLASAASGDGASNVGVYDQAGNLQASNVEAALAEIFTKLADTAAGEGAALVGIQDDAGNFTALNVEAALAEILSRLVDTATGEGASLVGIEDSAGKFSAAVNVEAALAEAMDAAGSGALPAGISESTIIEFSENFAERASLPTNSGSVRLHSFSDCLVEFGDSGVSADYGSIYFPAGTEVFGVPSGATHISVKSVGTPGRLNVSGLSASYRHELTTNAVLTYTAGSNSVALPSGTKARLFAMTDCFIEFGSASVSATETSTFFEAGTEIMKIPSGATHLAVSRYLTNGALYVSGAN